VVFGVILEKREKANGDIIYTQRSYLRIYQGDRNHQISKTYLLRLKEIRKQENLVQIANGSTGKGDNGNPETIALNNSHFDLVVAAKLRINVPDCVFLGNNEK